MYTGFLKVQSTQTCCSRDPRSVGKAGMQRANYAIVVQAGDNRDIPIGLQKQLEVTALLPASKRQVLPVWIGFLSGPGFVAGKSLGTRRKFTKVVIKAKLPQLNVLLVANKNSLLPHSIKLIEQQGKKEATVCHYKDSSNRSQLISPRMKSGLCLVSFLCMAFSGLFPTSFYYRDRTL